MSYTQLRLAQLGPAAANLATVGYQLFDAANAPVGTRVTVGVSERPPGSGTYGALVTIPTGFQGEIRWDSGGTPPKYASEEVNPGSDEGVLGPNGLDAVILEAGITPGVGLVDDTGAQLASINARQGLAVCLSALAGALYGAGTTSITVAPTALPSGAARLAAQVDDTLLGNRLQVNVRVPT